MMINPASWFNLYLENKLAHFYHLTSARLNPELAQEKMNQLVLDFFSLVSKKSINFQNIHNQSDILWLIPEDDKDYSVEDAHKISQFLNFKPLNLSHQFVVIAYAHRVTNRVYNTWLKLLEEPKNNVIIFLLNAHLSPPPATIISRAQSVQLHFNPGKVEFKQIQFWLEQFKLGKSLNDFYQWSLEIKEKWPFFLEELIMWEASKNHSHYFHEKDQLLKWLQWYQKSKAFHPSHATIVHQTFQILSQRSSLED